MLEILTYIGILTPITFDRTTSTQSSNAVNDNDNTSYLDIEPIISLNPAVLMQQEMLPLH